MAARSSLSKFTRVYGFQLHTTTRSSAKPFSSSSSPRKQKGSTKVQQQETANIKGVEDDESVPTSGISSRTLSDILKDLNKKVPETLLEHRTDPTGFSFKYIPWHLLNRVMNLHAPEWSGEVRSITYSADGKSVSVVYRVTLYGTDAEIFRESIGTASMSEQGYGDPVQKAEAMAFRRACARFGLGLHLYHEDVE